MKMCRCVRPSMGLVMMLVLLLAVAGCAATEQHAVEDGDDAIDRLREADQYFRAGNARAAQEAYRDVLAMDPGNVEVVFRLGALAYARGDADAALDRFREVQQLEPSHRRAAYNVSVLHLQRAHGALDHYLALVERGGGGSAAPDESSATLRDVFEAIEAFRVTHGR